MSKDTDFPALRVPETEEAKRLHINNLRYDDGHSISPSQIMEPLDEAEKTTIAELDATFKRLVKVWSAVKKSRKEWDFKTSSQTLEVLTEELTRLDDRWQDQQAVIQNALQADQDIVQSETYPAEVENALKAAGVPVRGEFPVYEFPPFKLTFSRDQGVVKLSMGRRSQQTKAFAPDQLATWVAGQYSRVINSKFDSTRFCRELLSAYETLNRLALQNNEVIWGHSVSLKEIYRLLTLKQSVRQDYPEPLFTYDLARLKEQPQIRYDRYQFDLEPSRETAKTLLLINSQGQESRVGTLAIHLVEG
ncbi:hypothetical protein [Phormidesmis sp. 146-33]